MVVEAGEAEVEVAGEEAVEEEAVEEEEVLHPPEDSLRNKEQLNLRTTQS